MKEKKDCRKVIRGVEPDDKLYKEPLKKIFDEYITDSKGKPREETYKNVIRAIENDLIEYCKKPMGGLKLTKLDNYIKVVENMKTYKEQLTREKKQGFQDALDEFKSTILKTFPSK